MNHNDVLQYPLLTEKSYSLMERNVYVFVVNKHANKIDVRNAIEFIFQVKVDKINIYTVPKKAKKVGRFSGYTVGYKKAYIYLKEGKINIFPEEVTEEKPKKAAKAKAKSAKSLDIEAKVAEKLKSKTTEAPKSKSIEPKNTTKSNKLVDQKLKVENTKLKTPTQINQRKKTASKKSLGK